MWQGWQFAVKGYFDTRLPGQSYFGAEPDALALSADGQPVVCGEHGVGCGGGDRYEEADGGRGEAGDGRAGGVYSDGVDADVDWRVAGGEAVCRDGEGARARGRTILRSGWCRAGGCAGRTDFTYIATLLYGSLAAIDPAAVDLKAATAEVLESNRMKAAEEKIAFAGGGDPIKHVIYIIKENRTYDQIFGDLKQNGKPVGNGDASLAMYGEDVTPNQHKLALQFGVLDNFFDSGEVSGDGHVWSNAAIGTDYLEKTWQQNYRNGAADV